MSMGVAYGRVDELSNIESEASVSVHQKDKARPQSFALACALLASLNHVIVGYDVGVMSGAIIFIQENLKITQFQQEALIGCLGIAMAVGNLAGGTLSDTLGRKWTMGAGAIIIQIGAVLMCTTSSYAILLVGRISAGVGIGFSVCTIGVYITEIAPAKSRGLMASFPEISVNLGILLGYVSNYAFSGLPAQINWRLMLGVGILPSILVGIGLFIIPESPRWLVLQCKVNEARLVLLKTIGNEKEVDETLAEIVKSTGANSEVDAKSIWFELLRPNRIVLKMLIVGVGVVFFQQTTGTTALMSYGPTIFKTAGIDDNTNLMAATIALGITKTTCVLVAIFLVDRIGRKPLLYISTISMTICLTALAASLALMRKEVAGISLAIFLTCGEVAFFSVGIGPLAWVLGSEVYPQRLRAQAFALGQLVYGLCGSLVTSSFLSISSAISVPGTLLVYSAISALSVLFVNKFVPETKGKTLEQIEYLFEEERWNECYTKLTDREEALPGLAYHEI